MFDILCDPAAGLRQSVVFHTMHQDAHRADTHITSDMCQACPILTSCSSREFKIQVVQLVPVVRVVK